MTDFTRYEDVVLLRDVLEERLYAGDVGTIVERHDVPGRCETVKPPRSR